MSEPEKRLCAGVKGLSNPPPAVESTAAHETEDSTVFMCRVLMDCKSFHVFIPTANGSYGFTEGDLQATVRVCFL